jgi:hypothetical protein
LDPIYLSLLRKPNGTPFLRVQKAMLTPSAVLAYWMRGSMAGLFYIARRKDGRAGRTGV